MTTLLDEHEQTQIFEPIAGVRLELYASVTKRIATQFLQHAGSERPDRWTPEAVAAGLGVPAGAWIRAHVGWRERIRRNPPVARRFQELYRELYREV